MLRGVQIAYLARESFAGFSRRKLNTMVTILIMASALLVLAVFTIATLNLGVLLNKAHSGIDMRVFLQQEPEADLQEDLRLRLLAQDGVRLAKYVDKEQALIDFRSELGEDADLLDALDENPLPASFIVTLVGNEGRAAKAQSIYENVSQWPEVAEIAFSEAWVEVLERWTFLFRMASLIIGLVVFISAVFVISNTVKLTVASSARLIDIMKQVGATNSFIRTPFLCEGMLEGLCAGVLAMGLLVLANQLLSHELAGLVFFTPAQIGGFILFCIFLGLIGSYAAMRKYLQL